ncbi:hypothetical protein EC912_106180 [Luteibacter rhizovicinus]|uniref:Uncharacterized protein n=1 Tax=Luteibacter rhizovicinus TaxID=242606 RepID=A0A4R3YKW4_9GAMM|nr:hypothetical protein [Luteibacter rhizovicinus]TCV92841.1 hypothetical protein EC912_106180 [Luteibacter rhizovicinus]
MRYLPAIAFAVACSAMAISGCQTGNVAAQPKPVSGFVTDMKAFDGFIATHPTPDQFRATYPDVQLVLPGMITTMEMRMNNSRYSAKLDAQGKITGGSFQ